MRYLTLLSLLALWGCEIGPSGGLLAETLVVQTREDENTAYSFYNTFTMAVDTLGLVSNATRDTLFVNNYSKTITAKIKGGMQTAGYQFVGKKQNPDLGVAAYVVENYSVYQQVSYPTYYGSNYYGYGGYYSYVSTSVSQSATLVIELLDLKNRNAQNQLKVIWLVYVGDLYFSNDPVGNVLEAIDQAFKQSPYLKKN